MNSVVRNLAYGVRLLRKAPGFSIVALVTLALGMAATTAIFSIADTVLWKPLPFRDPSRLLAIWEKSAAQNKFRLFVSPLNFWEWRKQSHTLEGLAAVRAARVNLTAGPNGHIEPEELRAERVSWELFPLLGVQPSLGRTFRPEEDQPGRSDFALLSYALWERLFGADRTVLDKTVVLSGRPYRIVGVLPYGFSVIDPAVDVWLPLAINFSDPRVGMGRSLMIVGRLRPGMAIEQARTEMEAIGDGLERSHPALNTGWRPSVFWLREEMVGKVREPLLILLGAVGFLLLMACANVANLLLARGAARRKEIAIRTALGATRTRILGQLLAQSLLLSIAAGAAGLLLARAAVVLLARLAESSVPRLAETRLDARLFLFALAASLATGLVFGIAPALHVSGGNLNAALVEGGRGGTTGRAGRRLRSSLVVAEVGLAMVLLIGAGLLARSFARLRAVNPGFQSSGLLTFRLSLAGGRNAATERRVAFFQQVTERLTALPGVRAVGAVSILPLTGLGIADTFGLEGRPLPPPAQRPIGILAAVSPSYFHAMGIPLISGRGFSTADRADSAPVVAVSQTLARRFFSGGNPVGAHLIQTNGRTAEIVGVVGDVKAERMDAEPWPTIYWPYSQFPPTAISVVVRTAGPQRSVVSAVNRAIHELDPEQPLADVRNMEDVVGQAVAGSRFNAVLLGTFAVVAFVLAGVGIYGVMAYEVTQRTHEVGIRMALGAQPRDVFQLVLGQAARLALAGITVGLVAAFALTRLMTAMLFGIPPFDLPTFAAIAFLLGGVALAAGYIPSQRAMALDVVNALRQE